jgi:hypothetical protein
MLSEDETAELTELRARAYGAGNGPSVTSADLERLAELEHARRTPAPTASNEVSRDLDAGAVPPRPPDDDAAAPGPPLLGRRRRSLAFTAATGLLLAATAFICGASVAESWENAPEPDSTAYFGSYSEETARSFERITRYIKWDDPTMLASMYSGDELTVWAGTTHEGVQNCAAFDSGGEIVLKCLSAEEDDFPHVLDWTNPSGTDAGSVTITIDDDGGMAGSFESSAP